MIMNNYRPNIHFKLTLDLVSCPVDCVPVIPTHKSYLDSLVFIVLRFVLSEVKVKVFKNHLGRLGMVKIVISQLVFLTFEDIQLFLNFDGFKFLEFVSLLLLHQVRILEFDDFHEYVVVK